jgi:hypothetical protein
MFLGTLRFSVINYLLVRPRRLVHLSRGPDLPRLLLIEGDVSTAFSRPSDLDPPQSKRTRPRPAEEQRFRTGSLPRAWSLQMGVDAPKQVIAALDALLDLADYNNESRRYAASWRWVETIGSLSRLRCWTV